MIERFIGYLQFERHASPRTIEDYGADMRKFYDFLTPPGTETPPLEQIDHRMIREFMAFDYDRGLQKSSVARKLATLRTFFKYCIRENLVRQNPARVVSSPKLPKRLPRVISIDEAAAMLDQMLHGIPSEPNARKKTLTPRQEEEARLLLRRDRAIMELLYASGLRVSELTGLEIGDIDGNTKMVRVLGKGLKERIVPFGSKALEALEAYMPVRSKILAQAKAKKPDHEAIFLNYRGGRLTVRSVRSIVAKYGRLLEIDWKLHPHALRHAFATHLLSDGADLRAIQELLGHARLSTTQRYTQATIEQLMATYDKAHPHA